MKPIKRLRSGKDKIWDFCRTQTDGQTDKRTHGLSDFSCLVVAMSDLTSVILFFLDLCLAIIRTKQMVQLYYNFK